VVAWRHQEADAAFPKAPFTSVMSQSMLTPSAVRMSAEPDFEEKFRVAVLR